MEETFTITRNGEIDPSYLRRERVRAFSGHIAHIGHSVAQMASTALRETITPVVLELEDAANGTHLRDEYFAHKRAERVSELRAQYF